MLVAATYTSTLLVTNINRKDDILEVRGFIHEMNLIHFSSRVVEENIPAIQMLTLIEYGLWKQK